MILEGVAGMLPAWFSQAACLDHPEPDLWFPEGPGASPRAAQEVCAGCPVLEPCGAYAESEGFTYGVFGGRSMRQVKRRDAA